MKRRLALAAYYTLDFVCHAIYGLFWVMYCWRCRRGMCAEHEWHGLGNPGRRW